MLLFEKAKAEDCTALSELAFYSEGCYDMDSDYMNKFKSAYSVRKDYILHNPVYILRDNYKEIGFFGISNTSDCWELDFFYIDIDYIGKGYGSIMWSKLLDVCDTLGINRFTLITSPEAAQFYIKHGAKVVGQKNSPLLEGRVVPIIEYQADNLSAGIKAAQ